MEKFTEGEIKLLKEVAMRTWCYIGDEVVQACGGGLVSRDTVWETVTDAGRMETLAATHEKELVKRFYALDCEELLKLKKVLFPFKSYE